MNKGFSIIICCHNSKYRLGPTLESISKLIIPDNYKVEIVLVDNNCSDGSSDFAKSFWSKVKRPIELKIVKEPKIGLTNARIRGIICSGYDFLIFCDDDNWLFPDYLLIVEENFQINNCLVLGGIGIPKSSIDFPSWFINTKGVGYAVGSEGRTKGPNQMVYGAGMAMRRDFAIKFISLKHTLLLSDRKGARLSSGGDSEICLIAGSRNVYFDNRLKFYHFLPEHRISFPYFLKLNYNFGKSSSLLYFYKLNSYSSHKLAFKVYIVSLLNDFKSYFYLNDDLFDQIKKRFLKGLIIGKIFHVFFFLKYRNMVSKNLSGD